MSQMTDHRLADVRVFHFGKFKYQRRGYVRLFVNGLTEIEQPRLAVMVGKTLGTNPPLLARFNYRGAAKTVTVQAVSLNRLIF